ncbi:MULTISPECIES: ribose 5-phosphate isomerase B [unclassified Bacillus (in: firmicutes)]|uniref:ribose 5-phosphate isomerase B n=1 Tax=unclassified Bacillus (in: firmicutes) TaxID=185979 RepID=UPI0004E1D6C3|nr:MULTISPECIES: ribose 5-phosphate isomerase B [unclassified Bacillus (in: firmicutes)]
MKVGIGNDHAGVQLKKELTEFLVEKGIEVIDFGTKEASHCYSAPIAKRVSDAVIADEVEKGILICGSGVGMSIAANKVKGIRCVVCSEPYTAKMSRSHNNTNVLAIGARVLGVEMAKLIVETWIETEYEGGKREISYQLITDIECS